MKGLELPERQEDFTADPVELFFDLGYVLVLTQLVGLLVHHPTWAGVGEVVLYASGSSARQTDVTRERPVDAVVMGIVDTWELGGDTVYRK